MADRSIIQGVWAAGLCEHGKDRRVNVRIWRQQCMSIAGTEKKRMGSTRSVEGSSLCDIWGEEIL
jgi:hypothetical protein